MLKRIVPAPIFDKAQELLQENLYGKRSLEVVYLLRAKLFCGNCGKPMGAETGTSKNGKINYYYKCAGRKKNSGCLKENIKKKETLTDLNKMSYSKAFYIGLIQCLSLVPGTSRSGSTILGASLLGTSRTVAAEFSFFLGIPAMFGASAIKLLKFFADGLSFNTAEIIILLVGCVVSFIVSILAIKFLVSYIKKHDFKAFGVYRIVLGVAVILYFVFAK